MKVEELERLPLFSVREEVRLAIANPEAFVGPRLEFAGAIEEYHNWQTRAAFAAIEKGSPKMMRYLAKLVEARTALERRGSEI